MDITRRSFVAGAVLSLGMPTLFEPYKPPAIWIGPHADDIVLSMSASLAQHLTAGRECICVTATRGCSEALQRVISDRAGYFVSVEEITRSRLDEFRDEVNAYAQLGKASYLALNNPDGFMTFDAARDILLNLQCMYPDADFKVMSPLDDHPDHAAFGQAAQHLAETGEITRPLRYYAKRENVLSGLITTAKPYYATAQQTDVVRQAIAGYRYWNPARHRYSAGNLSVPGSFREAYNQPISYVHT